MLKERFSLGQILKGFCFQAKGAWRILLFYTGVLLLLIAAIWVVSTLFDIEPKLFTKDPCTLGAGIHPAYGFVSTFGLVLWSASSCLCLFIWFALKDRLDRAQRRFLLISAALTLYFLFDDAFLFHEFLAPFYLHLDQKYVIALNCMFLLFYLLVFFRIILKTEYVFLFLSYLYFGLSVFSDFMENYFHLSINTLVEDGFRLLGIATWFIYFFRTSLVWIKEVPQAGNSVG
jgi:hypothetical protein